MLSASFSSTIDDINLINKTLHTELVNQSKIDERGISLPLPIGSAEIANEKLNSHATIERNHAIKIGLTKKIF